MFILKQMTSETINITRVASSISAQMSPLSHGGGGRGGRNREDTHNRKRRAKKSDRLEVKVTKCPIIRGKLSELIIVGDRKINNLRIARSCHEFVFCLHRRHDGADGRGRRRSGQKSEEERIQSDIVALQHESSIFR